MSKGKFSSKKAQRLYPHLADMELGSVQEMGWFGWYKSERAILREDSQGFVDVVASGDACPETWLDIEAQYADYYGDDEDGLDAQDLAEAQADRKDLVTR